MIYVVCGHLGSGKTLLSLRIAHDYLKAGKKVAANITFNLEKLMPPSSRLTMTKLPGVPTEHHLTALGNGYEGKYDESKFGLIVLDEAGKWLNSRDWQDKERRGLFAWITHARKFGWDVILIVQDFEALDAQIRRAVTEVHVQCMRLDRVKVPYLPIRLPRLLIGSGRYGGPTGMKFDRWVARGNDYFNTYDTREAVRHDVMYDGQGTAIDMRASSSTLSAWHLRGRYLRKRPDALTCFLGAVKWMMIAALLPLLFLPSARRAGGKQPSPLQALRSDWRVVFPRAQPGPYEAIDDVG